MDEFSDGYEIHGEPEDRYTYWGDRLVLTVAIGAIAAYLAGWLQ